MAWRFMDLEWQNLKLLYSRIRSDDVEELLIVSYKTRALNMFVAANM
jgi:hypothetical protein